MGTAKQPGPERPRAEREEFKDLNPKRLSLFSPGACADVEASREAERSCDEKNPGHSGRIKNAIKGIPKGYASDKTTTFS